MLPMFGALPGERRGYVDAGGGQVHYREMGTGPAVLLCHQAPWAAIQFHRVMPLLAAAGYRAIAPDLPGHGLSDPLDPPSVAGFAAIVPPLLDALGEARAALIGHHGGALVAGHAAAAYPDRAAVLILDNAPLYSDEERAERRAKPGTALPALAPDGGHFTDRWALARRFGDPGWSDATVHLSVLTYFANGPSTEHAHLAAPAHDFAADLPRIACPTLVLAGRGDPLHHMAERLIARRPEWACAELPGGASMTIDRAEEWMVPVRDFLRACWPPRS